jgi:hypothetical protein
MTKARKIEIRTLAEKHVGKQASAAILLECLNEIEDLEKTITHLRLRSKAPKQKPLGIGETYGVG